MKIYVDMRGYYKIKELAKKKKPVTRIVFLYNEAAMKYYGEVVGKLKEIVIK